MENGEWKKLAIVYGVTGLIVLLAIPVLGWNNVLQIVGETTATVIIMVAALTILLLVVSFFMGKKQDDDEPEA